VDAFNLGQSSVTCVSCEQCFVGQAALFSRRFRQINRFVMSAGFGRPYYRSRLWHTVSSVCLSVVCDGRFCLIFARTAQRSVLHVDGTKGLSSSKPSAYCRTVRSELKPEVVFKVQKMARYTSFCLIMGPFKGEVPVFARLCPVRVRVSFMTAGGSTVGHPSNSWASCFFVEATRSKTGRIDR